MRWPNSNANSKQHLIDLVLRGLLLVCALAFLWSASTARAALLPDEPKVLTRGGHEESAETRMALLRLSMETQENRIAHMERNISELVRDQNRLERSITAIQAVAEANTQANWIVGGGFVAQFLFSLFRYLRLQLPNGSPRK